MKQMASYVLAKTGSFYFIPENWLEIVGSGNEVTLSLSIFGAKLSVERESGNP